MDDRWSLGNALAAARDSGARVAYANLQRASAW